MQGCPLQYSGLENPVDCIVHEVAKSQTRLSDFSVVSVYSSESEDNGFREMWRIKEGIYVKLALQIVVTQ